MTYSVFDKSGQVIEPIQREDNPSKEQQIKLLISHLNAAQEIAEKLVND